MTKSLKTIVKNHLAALSSLQFLVFVFVVMAFVLALMFPEARGRFFDVMGGLCSKIQW